MTDSWKSVSIKIPNKKGKDDIDIISAFSMPYEGKVNTTLAPQVCHNVWFPLEVLYPPTWDDKNILFNAIAKAAKDQTNTVLILGSSNKKLNNHGEIYMTMKCNQGRRYYAQGDAKKKNRNVWKRRKRSLFMVLPMPTAQNPIVLSTTKKSSTTDGKMKKRRYMTTKPDVDGGEKLCSFKLRLLLKPGSYWRLQCVVKRKGYHNHLKKAVDELQVPISRLNDDEKNMACKTKQYGHSGTACNMMNDCTNNNLSKEQLRHLKETNDNGKKKKSKPKSSAAKLMDFAQSESENVNKRYIALYHHVTESSLLAVKKSKKKKKINIHKDKCNNWYNGWWKGRRCIY